MKYAEFCQRLLLTLDSRIVRFFLPVGMKKRSANRVIGEIRGDTIMPSNASAPKSSHFLEVQRRVVPVPLPQPIGPPGSQLRVFRKSRQTFAKSSGCCRFHPSGASFPPRFPRPTLLTKNPTFPTWRPARSVGPKPARAPRLSIPPIGGILAAPASQFPFASVPRCSRIQYRLNNTALSSSTCITSMGPRSIERGNTLMSLLHRELSNCFNGTAFFRSRRRFRYKSEPAFFRRGEFYLIPNRPTAATPTSRGYPNRNGTSVTDSTKNNLSKMLFNRVIPTIHRDIQTNWRRSFSTRSHSHQQTRKEFACRFSSSCYSTN